MGTASCYRWFSIVRMLYNGQELLLFQYICMWMFECVCVCVCEGGEVYRLVLVHLCVCGKEKL